MNILYSTDIGYNIKYSNIDNVFIVYLGDIKYYFINDIFYTEDEYKLLKRESLLKELNL